MYEYLMLLTFQLQTLIKKITQVRSTFIITLVRKVYEKRCKLKV